MKEDSDTGSTPGDEGRAYQRKSFGRTAELFEVLRVLSVGEREVRLAELAATDSEVYASLVSLFGHHDSEMGILADPDRAIRAEDLASALEGNDAAMPEQIGPYHPIAVLGAGGMGTVYLAERTDKDFEQRVAVKVLRASVHDSELQLRFRTERRILAGLRHPNIAMLLDGGVTDEGLSYVVMEHVEGSDLLTHSRSEALSVDARLRLFMKICEAVDHAHRRLVVHRDLKPSNILVTAQGEPKLLDFGIAKLLDNEQNGESIAVTGAGMMLLTPDYASPEQVRGDPITTATDVYALGTILYELLTGQRAQVLLNRSVTELERVVCHEDPPSLSTAVEQDSAAGTQLGISTRALRRRLSGDLDNIVATALRKEPERRYGSVRALLADIECYLGGLPVSARKDTWSYRGRKFVRRNRLPVVAGGVILALVIGSSISLANQARQLAEQRDVALRESAVAREISDFLVGMFQMAEPDPMRAEQVRAKQLLLQANHRIENEIDSGPLVRAGLMDAIGRANLALGLFDEAERLIDGARDLRVGSDVPQQNTSGVHLLGVLRYCQGRFVEARELILACLDELEANGKELSESYAINELQLVQVLRETGEFVAGLDRARHALEIRKKLYGEKHSLIASAIAAIGVIEYEQGEFEAAEKSFLASEAMLRELYGESFRGSPSTQRMLGGLYKQLERFDDAERCLELALATDRATKGGDHPDVDEDLFQLAQLSHTISDFDEAERRFEVLIERDREHLGASHPYTAEAIGQLASVQSSRGDYERSEKTFTEALAMLRATSSDDNPELATLVSNLGVMYHRSRQLEKAGPLFREALEIRKRIYPSDHPAVLTSHSLLALISYQKGDFAAALEQYQAVLAGRKKKLGEHSHTAGSTYAVGMALLSLKRKEEAVQYFRDSLTLYDKTLPADHFHIFRPLYILGKLENDAEQFAPAAEFLQRAVGIRIKNAADAASDVDLAHSKRELGRALIGLRRHAEAKPHLISALEIYTATWGRDHRAAQQCEQLLAQCK